MKSLSISMAVAATLWTVSLSVAAKPKGIAVLAVENQAGLANTDLTTISNLVETAFKSLPNAQYAVGKLLPKGDDTATTSCDETCLVQKAGAAGADFAVYISISSLGGKTTGLLKLYDAKSGQLLRREVTEPMSEISDLAKPIDWAAKKLAAALPRTTPAPQVARPTPQPPAVNDRNPNVSTLMISSTPSGASVAVGGRLGQQFIGTTPLETELTPHRYRVLIYKKGYPEENIDLQLYPGQSRSLHVDLYRSKNLVVGGHLSLWPGIVIMFPAVILLAADHTKSGIALTAVSACLITAGTTLLVVGLIRLKDEKKERSRGRVSFGADPNSLSLGYAKSF